MMNNHYHTSALQQQNVIAAQQQHNTQPTTLPGVGGTAANATHYSYLQHTAAAAAIHMPTHQLGAHHPQLHTASPQQPQHHPQQHLLPQQALLANVGPSTAATTNATLYGLEKRYYTTAAAATSTTHPNTILITNNFSHQQPTSVTSAATQKQHQTANNFKGNNIRIISTAAPNIYNINHHAVCTTNNNNNNNNIVKTADRIYATNAATTATQEQQHHVPHEFVHNTYTAAVAAPTQQFAAVPPPPQASANAMQSFYMTTAAPETLTVSTPNVSSNMLQRVTGTKLLPPQVNAVLPMDVNGHIANAASSSTVASVNSHTNNSTVVLDRINICINNHYAEATSAATTPPSICAPPATASLSTPQQPSPVIPAIQHKPIVDSTHHHAHYADSSSGACRTIDDAENCITELSSAASVTAAVIVIDEPDSTTATPQTPPTTPENNTPTKCSTNNAVQSPSSTTNTTTLNLNLLQNNKKQLKNAFAAVTQTIDLDDDEDEEADEMEDDEEDELEIDLAQEDDEDDDNIDEEHEEIGCKAAVDVPSKDVLDVDITTPPTPTKSVASTPQPFATSEKQSEVRCKFNLHEDVFIERQDGRFYLGTIMESAQQKYLVRFDDKSEQWCVPEELRKLGSGQETKTEIQQPMCVACKQSQFADVVEICERCGRGYHRNCTTETLPGSCVWFCKRCAKPMKLQMPQGKPAGICRQLPYHAEKLTWDEKHRVNEEQIYCYCGGSGKFDHNMLQCCKCRNWFHTACMQDFKGKLLRGDSFFVFCCTVCNDGNEFLRRLQIDWVDVLHLTLYNLRKHQHQKYHHLIKDIWPFILEQRHLMPICREWRDLTETALMERIKQTLKDYTERFICGRESKRDHSYYGLRQNGPPIMPQINVAADEILTDDMLIEKFKLLLLPDASENITAGGVNAATEAKVKSTKNNTKQDVYEFRIDDETSEDEIPIKQIMEKAKQRFKKSLTSAVMNSSELLDIADDNANDACTANLHTQNKKSPHKKDSNSGASTSAPLADIQKSSRKRKAFRLSKSYKEIAAKRYENNATHQNNNRICDLSSDENSSSSSRGTSLDLIIPPPVNFLGRNNPFLMVTPKKKDAAGSGIGKPLTTSSSLSSAIGGIKSSIFNTTTLDFSSKLVQLKNAGIFPNLSTSELAKAAGQPRTVRTIKRRLSAKDITIGPNQEVRRRRNRRLTSHIEVISTTTINPIPSHFFPIYAKDLNANHSSNTSNNTAVNHKQQQPHMLQPPPQTSSTSSSVDSMPTTTTTGDATTPTHGLSQKPTHGRLLRQRPQKCSPGNSRRSSTSSNQSTSNNNNGAGGGGACSSSASLAVSSSSCNATQDCELAASGSGSHSMHDLKQTVNKYFGGAINRIESGEPYAIRAKRRLANGQIQYLIEWGSSCSGAEPPPPASPASTVMPNGKTNNGVLTSCNEMGVNATVATSTVAASDTATFN